MSGFEFLVLAEDGAARRGVIRTPHGSLETPGFIAVATRAALKSLDPEAARRAGVQALIANTYHLEMQPGAARVAAAGGLHRLMGWQGLDRKSTRLNSSHVSISYAVFCLKKKI